MESTHKGPVMRCTDASLHVNPDKQAAGFETRPTEFRNKREIVAVAGENT